MSRAQQMAADPKQILHRTVDCCEALQMAGRRIWRSRWRVA